MSSERERRLSKPNARVMIVTGASSGVGRALAQQAAAEGFGVFAVARRSELLAELERSNAVTRGHIETLALDLLSPGAAARVVTAALERFARIDVLVNNAGTVASGPIAEQSDAALREQYHLHAIVPLALLREALPALRVSRGQVFFVGSGVARVPVAGLGAYPSAKAAIRSSARIARNELRGSGIAVTYLDPGAVDTELMARAGFAGAPKGVARPANAIARGILRAVERRPSTLNAAPWQTAFVGVAELFPAITDAVLARFPHIVGTQRRDEKGTSGVSVPKLPQSGESNLTSQSWEAPRSPQAQSSSAPDPIQADSAQSTEASETPQPSAFDVALEPLARRMERLKLPRDFVAGLLQRGAMLDADAIALRWAGMPNKNERALVHEILGALADAQFLERTQSGAYTVLKPATLGETAAD